MKKLLCLMGGAMFLVSYIQAQKINIDPFYIDDRVPDLPLSNLINYKDSTALLSSFGHKLIILDFWATHCGPCIAMFPKEDSLQKTFKDQVQFILVTYDGEAKVKKFFHSWDSTHNMHLSMPIVTTDRLLRKLFRFQFIPHYIWITPNGRFLGQTSETFIDSHVISKVLKDMEVYEERLKREGWPPSMYGFPKADIDFIKLLKSLKN